MSWDLVQRVYDGVVRGDMGIWHVGLMFIAWAWAWGTYCILGRMREGRTEMVNAALYTGIVRKKVGTVIEM